MNKKEYLEAQRELDIERRLAKEKRLDIAFNAFMFIVCSVALFFGYYVIFGLSEVVILPHIFYWAIGFGTVIWINRLFDLIESNKKEVTTNG